MVTQYIPCKQQSNVTSCGKYCVARLKSTFFLSLYLVYRRKISQIIFVCYCVSDGCGNI